MAHHPLDRYPKAYAMRLLYLEECCRWLDKQSKPTRCLQKAADMFREKMEAREGMMPSWTKMSAKTMTRMWYRWKSVKGNHPEEDWVFIAFGDKRMSRTGHRKSPTDTPAFQAYVQQLYAEKKSVTATAAELKARWLRGEDIPWDDGVNDRTSIPKGWSSDNLGRRIILPQKPLPQPGELSARMERVKEILLEVKDREGEITP